MNLNPDLRKCHRKSDSRAENLYRLSIRTAFSVARESVVSASPGLATPSVVPLLGTCFGH